MQSLRSHFTKTVLRKGMFVAKDVSSATSRLPLRQVEERDDRRLSVVSGVLGHDLLHPGVVFIRKIEECLLVILWRILVLYAYTSRKTQARNETFKYSISGHRVATHVQ